LFTTGGSTLVSEIRASRERGDDQRGMIGHIFSSFFKQTRKGEENDGISDMRLIIIEQGSGKGRKKGSSANEPFDAAIDDMPGFELISTWTITRRH
jgi:hypothetical protein